MRPRSAAVLFLVLLAAQAIAVFLTIGLGAAFLIPFILAVSFAFTVFLITTVWSVVSGAPFVPTDARNVERMLRVANVGPEDKVVDLGSGDGRILIAAAKAGAQAEGWEISPYLWLFSLWNVRRARVGGRVRVVSYAFRFPQWPIAAAGGNGVHLYLIDDLRGLATNP